MAAKLIRLTHKIAIQLHLVAESYTICSSAPGGQSGNFWIYPRIWEDRTDQKAEILLLLLLLLMMMMNQSLNIRHDKHSCIVSLCYIQY
jgi:hypothetical protein